MKESFLNRTTKMQLKFLLLGFVLLTNGICFLALIINALTKPFAVWY
jgi:hypothetical protein